MGEAERLRFEVTGIDLAGAVGEADDSGEEEDTEISSFADGVERSATSDSEDEDTERLRWSAEDSLVLAGVGAKADEADDDDDEDSEDIEDERLGENGADRMDWVGKGAEELAAEEEDEEEEEEDDAEELDEVELLERLRLAVLGGCACSSVALEVDDFVETTGLLGGMGPTPFLRGPFRGFIEEALLEAPSSSPLSSPLSLLLSCLGSFATALFLFDFGIEVEVLLPLEDSPIFRGTSN